MVKRIQLYRGQGNTLNIEPLNLTFHNVFPLLVDVVFLVGGLGTYNGHDPRNKALVLVLEELHVMVHLEVDRHGELKLQHVRQLLYELEYVSLLLSMIILNSLRQLVKQLDVHIILDLHVIQRRYLLLQHCLLRVIARDDGGNGTCSERERYDSEKHQEYSEDLFFEAVRGDVSIAHGNKSRHSKVESCDIKIRVVNIIQAFLVDPIHL